MTRDRSRFKSFHGPRIDFRRAGEGRPRAHRAAFARSPEIAELIGLDRLEERRRHRIGRPNRRSGAIQGPIGDAAPAAQRARASSGPDLAFGHASRSPARPRGDRRGRLRLRACRARVLRFPARLAPHRRRRLESAHRPEPGGAPGNALRRHDRLDLPPAHAWRRRVGLRRHYHPRPRRPHRPFGARRPGRARRAFAVDVRDQSAHGSSSTASICDCACAPTAPCRSPPRSDSSAATIELPAPAATEAAPGRGGAGFRPSRVPADRRDDRRQPVARPRRPRARSSRSRERGARQEDRLRRSDAVVRQERGRRRRSTPPRAARRGAGRSTPRRAGARRVRCR